MAIRTSCVVLVAALSLAAQTQINVQVLNQLNTTAGLNGRLQSFLSTSFQPAEWDYTFFSSGPAGGDKMLWELVPQHIRLQPVSQGVPMTGENQWSFSTIDPIVQPVLGSRQLSRSTPL